MTGINNTLSFLTGFLLVGFLTPGAQALRADPDKNPRASSAKIAIVLQPYTGHSSGSELSKGPATLLPNVQKLLAGLDIEMSGSETVNLTPEEEKDYGVWHRVGLADGHLGDAVAKRIKEGEFVLGLLGNCNSLLGMLAGVQKSGPPRRPQKVGLIWIDAHGDFNTPETTLSGMLGGMPVAVAAGKCLYRLRLKAGLEPAIPTRNIVMMGVRDLDPLEEELIDNSDIVMVPTEDIIKTSAFMRDTLDRLSQRVDAVYVHIDLDVLDASALPGANFLVPNGPSGTELGKALGLILQNKKVKALGIASFPTAEQGQAESMASTLETIRGGFKGWQSR
jgi:arginase